jgi:hypothetical protein
MRYIRSLFCKHDFIHVKRNEYRGETVDTFLCSKCGWIRKVKTK